MKKFIKSSLLAFTLITSIVMNGCDVFENFLFNVPLSYQFESSGLSLFDSGSACLEEDDTFNDVKDKINSITFVEGYIAVLNINPPEIQGNATLTLRGGSDQSGPILIQYELNNVRPADYPPESPLKLDLDQAQIQIVNDYLANESNPRCFFGTFEVTDIQNGGTSNSITIRLDVLFNVDATF